MRVGKSAVRSRPCPPRSIVHGGAYPRIRTAATDVARHRGVDRGIVRVRIALEQGHRTHDLPGLAVTALRHVVIDPRLLHRVQPGRAQALDGEHVPALHRR